MEFKFESQLEEFAISFIKSKFVQFRWQVPLYNRTIDLVCVDKYGNLIGIEFKLKNWKKAIRQALNNSNAFDYVYVCVPGGRYNEKLFNLAKNNGVGVLLYHKNSNSLKEELSPEKIKLKWLPNQNFIKEYLTFEGVN